MATGNSKTQWNGKHAPPAPSLSSDRTLDIALAYEGKRSEDEILGTTPADVRLVWRGTEGDDTRAFRADNRLYYGDNLPILAALLQDASVSGQVRLVYIDPPFATKSVFQSRTQEDAYGDLLTGAHYIEYLRERLVLLRELLAEDGSIYVHLDDNMAFHAKVLMDEVFGRKNFRNWITRKKCNPKNYTRKAYGNIADYILLYTKSETYFWNRPTEPWSEDRHPKEYHYIEEETGRRYMKVPIHAPGVRRGETGKPWRGMTPPPGKHWQYPPTTLDAMDARGEIYWSPSGNPRRKVYLDGSPGIPVQDMWLDFKDAHNQNVRITGYPTEKNPDLLRRIVAASSNPGDLVLDCFSGSGTTLAVAQEVGRRWIGIDNSPEAMETTLRRFAMGLERMGDFVGRRKDAVLVGEVKTSEGSTQAAGRLEATPLFPPDPPKSIQPTILTEPTQEPMHATDGPASALGFTLYAIESGASEIEEILKGSRLRAVAKSRAPRNPQRKKGATASKARKRASQAS